MSFPLASPPGPYSWASNTSLKIEDGPVGKDCQAKGMGRQQAAGYARQIDGGVKMGNQSTKQTGTTVVPWTTVVPVNEEEAKREFACVVLDISRGRLAKAAKRGKDAAKRWQEGTRLPSMLTILNMAQPGKQGIPEVRNYVLTKLGIDPARLAATEHFQLITPQLMEAAVAAVYQVMHQPGPDGDAVRAALTKMGRGQP